MQAVATGAVAGIGMGYVLQRGQLCFHSMFASAFGGRGLLLRGWVLAVAVASVGLSVLYLTSWSHGLNTGLPFVPVSNVVGGVIIGVGMVVASTCVSGLFYKLGSGMAGATLGLVGWVGGELAARRVHLPGPTVLRGGESATFAGVLGVPRLACSVVFFVVVGAILWRWRSRERPWQVWQWNWPTVGIALGLVTIAGWVLARIGGSGFGPSTAGASASRGRGVTELVADRVPARDRHRWVHRRPDVGWMVAAGRIRCPLWASRGGRLPARRRRLDRRRLQPRPRPVRCGPAQCVLLGGRRVDGRRGRPDPRGHATHRSVAKTSQTTRRSPRTAADQRPQTTGGPGIPGPPAV